MRIIFLDFDGVLVNRQSFLTRNALYERGSRQQEKADPPCVNALNRIIRETGAYIVVSSSWRLGTPLCELETLLLDWGVRGVVLDKTPVYPSKTRGFEIEGWLQTCAATNFVILDDDTDMGALLPRLVKTSFKTGLTEADADKAIALLLGK
jgi:hypothetical protein